MNVELHGADEHAPYVHRYLKVSTTQVKKGKLRGETVTVTSEREFVICPACNHWNLGLDCGCEAGCHDPGNWPVPATA